MIDVTAEELGKILETIEEAFAMHDKWLNALHRTFACGLPASDFDVMEDAYRHCAFGHWYYSKANAGLRAIPAFKKVGELHQTMHQTVREICAKRKALGKIPVDDYDVLLGEVGRFREALRTLEQRVTYTLQHIDALTGAINNSRLLPDLKRDQEVMRETGRPYSLLLVDVDVKEINASYGHQVGDAVLRAGVDIIKKILVGAGRVYRYSGAEFVICLPGLDQAAAETVREKLLQGIGTASAAAIGTPQGALNIHYGIAALDPRVYLSELIDRCAKSTYTFDFATGTQETVLESTASEVVPEDVTQTGL